MAAREKTKGIETRGHWTSEWKKSKIAEAVDHAVSRLAETWNLDEDEIVNLERPLAIEVGGFNARVDEGMISVSDPDHYRTGMKDRFNDRYVRGLVDATYPVPFHEVLEETGQLIGRRADNGWEFEATLAGGARDEFHGILALERYAPPFIEPYRRQVESNLEAVIELNNEEQEERAIDLLERNPDQEGLVEFCESEKGREYALSRPGNYSVPLPFSVKLAGQIMKEDIDPGELDPEQVTELRYEKMRRESVKERANLAAFNVAEEVYESRRYGPEDAFNGEYFNTWFEENVMAEDRRICDEYDIPREPEAF